MSAAVARLRAVPSLKGNALLAGGTLLFLSSTLVNAGNYLFNLILGRWLGPAAFADLSLIVTILLVLSFATTTLATLAARFSAIRVAERDEAGIAAVRSWLGRQALLIGVGFGLLMIAGSGLLSAFFHTESAWPFVIMGAGIPLFFLQGVDRGVLQGRTRFVSLAASYQAEMWTRLLGGVALVGAGLAVNGAVGAIALSFAATWLIARRGLTDLPAATRLSRADRAALIAFAGPVIAGLIGQILINNSDVLIIKHYFNPEDAGLYAALALVGRIVFFATWSVVMVTFPVVAQKHERGEPHAHLLWMSVGIVLVVAGGVTAVMAAAPELVVRVLFGSDFLPIADLLWLYALATGLYALANVAINYQLSTGRGAGSIFALAAGLSQVAGLMLFHDTMRTAVVVQITIMAALAISVFAWTLAGRDESRGTAAG